MNGSGHYGVYSQGDFGCSDTKSSIVRTESGPRELYCLESPENWFEDFGSGIIHEGYAHIELSPDFLQTVTINSENPFKVFIQLENTNISYRLIKSENSFDIITTSLESVDVKFDYRIVAKRKGYENLRMKYAPIAYVDHLLYPDIRDVPQEYRLEWILMVPRNHRDSTWLEYLTPEQLEKLSGVEE